MSNTQINNTNLKSINFSYISKLDHLRFFAAAYVIFHHFRGEGFSVDGDFSFSYLIKLWLEKGSSGVSLFLVLSAFLFTLIARGGSAKISYGKFVYNRILRIFPLATVLVFIVIAIVRQDSTPMDILRILTLQLNTGHSYTGWGHDIFPIGPIWTISVEFQFYLLFPFLILFSHKYGLKYLFQLILMMMLLRFVVCMQYSWQIYYSMYHSIIGRLDQFAVGMIIGVLYYRGVFSFLNNTTSAILFIASLTGLSLLFWSTLHLDVANKYYVTVLSFFLEAILWSGVIISYLSFNLTGVLWSKLGKFFAYLGSLSFSMYLLHFPILENVNRVFNIPAPQSLTESLFYSLIRLVIVILVAILSYNAIEKPFMSLRVKYIQQKEGA